MSRLAPWSCPPSQRLNMVEKMRLAARMRPRGSQRSRDDQAGNFHDFRDVGRRGLGLERALRRHSGRRRCDDARRTPGENIRPTLSVLSEEKKLSIAASSQTFPERLMERSTPLSRYSPLGSVSASSNLINSPPQRLWLSEILGWRRLSVRTAIRRM